MRALRLAALACGLGLLVAGCKTPAAGDGAARKPLRFPNPFQHKKEGRPPQALPAIVFGEIRHVNAEGRFVLVDTGSAVTAQPGEVLLAISEGQVTGELKLTELKSPPFLIADIVSGQPVAGQKVYRRD
ncbi:MAG: hypothetical protein N2322_00045 [Terrimicrobiaceae bacterium]|nr:hypothetical protein [Terrimicrobiaceae bacterium]